MEAYDCLPPELRLFVSTMNFNLLERHLLGGEAEILRVKALYEAGVQPTYYEGRN